MGDPGRLIAFEGVEGAGKSTQLELLRRVLEGREGRGREVVVTREPGGTPAGERIRALLLDPQVELHPRAEALLFAAAREDHVRHTIAPALAQGSWVICDRFFDSTRVYQGAVGKLDLRYIHALERITVGALKPDLTFIMDVPVEVGMSRAGRRRKGEEPDRFEAESRAFHEQLGQAYRLLAQSEPERCVLIDATQPKGLVGDRIWQIVGERLHPERLAAAGAAR